MKNSKLSRRLILGCVMVFFYFPILYMLIFSFNGSRSLTSFDGFSLQWYHKMFNDRNMMEAIIHWLPRWWRRLYPRLSERLPPSG